MKKMLVVLFALISFVAFSQENVVKEWHFVQPDGSVKIGHEVFPNIDINTKCGTIYDPTNNTTMKIRWDETIKDYIIDTPSGPNTMLSIIAGGGAGVECHCTCCGNGYCPNPNPNTMCYTCPRCNNKQQSPYYYFSCGCGHCHLVWIQE